MRIQANPTAAATLPAAPTKSTRTPHAGSNKPAAAPVAPAGAAAPAPKPAAAATVATAAQAAEVAAAPETYGGAGSLLDAHA
jgi:hypothetical protein